MKLSILTLCLFIIMSTACLANQCQYGVCRKGRRKLCPRSNKGERNQRTTDVQNAAMADPEADRSEVFS